tara:strand:+ start:170 stop:475 length:306 start_codon:yes stop_codon:yes gene_type:complete
MSFSRYSFSERKIDVNGSEYISFSNASYRVFKSVEAGALQFDVKILEEGERIDTIAGVYYGKAAYWWIIAAASGIGYALQVPPGTVLRIPTSLSEVFGVLT